jgi:hypothetical protein
MSDMDIFFLAVAIIGVAIAGLIYCKERFSH